MEVYSRFNVYIDTNLFTRRANHAQWKYLQKFKQVFPGHKP